MLGHYNSDHLRWIYSLPIISIDTICVSLKSLPFPFPQKKNWRSLSWRFDFWWFQPIWKICSSKWVHLPQGSGWKFQKYLSCHHLDENNVPLDVLKIDQQKKEIPIGNQDFLGAVELPPPSFRSWNSSGFTSSPRKRCKDSWADFLHSWMAIRNTSCGIFAIPIGSMGLVYLLTFGLNLW